MNPQPQPPPFSDALNRGKNTSGGGSVQGAAAHHETPVPQTPLALQANEPAPTASSQGAIASAQVRDEAPTNEIDKEWVNKTRDVVGQTQGDPYTQCREIAKLRTEYVRVRFDKQINIAEEQ